MIGDYVRLGLATLLVLAPGRLIARSLGLRSTSATLAFALGASFCAWAVVFALHSSIWLAIGLLALIALVALLAGGRPAARRAGGRSSAGAHARGRPAVFAGGVVLGLALWHVAGVVSGDGLFHLGRVRKLVDLGDLHLRSVDELAYGGLHPGYAFPLWHCFLALVSKLSGLDPYVVVDHEASLLAPLALLVVWEAGVALFASAAGGLAVVAATLGLYCFAAGHGGSYATLALPPTVARQILLPAFYALFFGFLRSGRRAELAALSVLFGSLAIIHSTYALFGLIPLAAFALVRRGEWGRSALALACACGPAFAVYVWLRPIIEETLTVNPSAASKRDAVLHYAGQLAYHSLDDFSLRAGVVGRAGAVAVAALALVPLAGFAARRAWGAFVLAGSVTMLALMLVPLLFVHFSELVSISQSRRAAGFIPFAFAFAGGLTLLSRSWLVLPASLAAGIALQELWPGDFAAGSHGGPALLTWFALLGGAAALVLGLRFARSGAGGRPVRTALAALLFVLPVALHGFAHWSPTTPSDPDALPAALRSQLAALPARSVILAAPALGYEIVADFPFYVVAAPLAHVAHTRANDPELRIKQVNRWLQTGALPPGYGAIPPGYGAQWAVRKEHGRYRLYRLT